MSDAATDELMLRVFMSVVSGFPVSESPYCDMAAELGVSELDVLSAALELRECGRLARIAAEFEDLEGFLAGASMEDADLALLVSTDLPTGEHPYAEVAAQLQLRGIDTSADDVIARLLGWIADGTVVRVAGRPA